MWISEKSIRKIFRISVWLKGVHSAFEILSGFSLAFVSHDAVLVLAQALIRAELAEDPGDKVANIIRESVAGFSPASQSFAAWYLLSHGALKLVMVVGVLADRRWAYPGFIIVLTGFIAYQLYKLDLGFSWALIAITVLDAVVLVLAWHEWNYIRSHGGRLPPG